MNRLNRIAARVDVHRGAWLGIVAAFLLLFGSHPLYGQAVNANLFGTVTDPSTAVVPGARMTLTSVDRGFILNAESDDNGAYSFQSVPPGDYRLGATKDGFRATSISGIKLLVNQQARIDVQLQVGEATVTVDVQGAAPIVESSNASLGTVIGAQETTQLPLNLRRYGALALLVPGTAPDNGGSAAGIFGSPFSETTYAANGARTSSNNYLIDGVDSYNLGRGGFAVQPPPDAVAEFKIQTNIYSAAYGKQAGSTINLITKSGTNEIHGTVYEFIRNDVLDARNFFVAEVPKYRRNQYGVAIGGPFKKETTFWFVNFEGLRDLRGSSSTGTVPTAAMKSGDLSSSLTGNSINLCGAGGPAELTYDSGQMFDPGSLSQFTCPSGSASAGQSILVGNPFPGNRITSINPVAKRLIDSGVFPEPNRSGFRNYINGDPRTRNDELLDVRIDHIFGPSDRIFGRYLLGQSASIAPRTLTGFDETFAFRGQNLALSWTKNIGATLLNEARFGFQRNYSEVQCTLCPRGDGFMAGLGIENLQAISPEFEGHPSFAISEFTTVGDNGYRPFIYPDMVEKYQDTLTWMKDKHIITVGADIQFWQELRLTAPASPYGSANADGRYSSLANLIPDAQLVSGFADFLSGYPSSGQHSLRFQPNNFVGGGFWNVYAQDDIKVTPNLTLNIGVRYEYRRPPVDKRDSIVNFLPTGDPFSGPGNGLLITALDDTGNDALCADPAYSYLNSSDGRCLIATSAQRREFGFDGRSRRTLVYAGSKSWAPRFGLAWRPASSDKFVIRTGYGLFYDFLPTENLAFTQNNPVVTPTGLYTTAFGAPPPLTNGAPTTYETMFGGEAIPPIQEQFLSLYPTPNYETPYLQQWSFGVSSQLAQDLALEVNYVGNKGTNQGNLHLFANQPNPGIGDLQPRRPYPDFNIMLFTSTDVNTNYHSLQSKLTKRFSSGVTFLGSYTWSKSINDGEGNEGFAGGNGGNLAPQNDNNRGADRGRSYLDARHRLVASYVWELPFGSGKRFLDRKGWQDRVLGGWQISGVTTFQAGYPFTLFAAQDFSNTGTLTPRPDRICHGKGDKTLESWFDAGCFTNDYLLDALASGQPRFGNSGRNILDGPGLIGWDLALLKEFGLNERFKLQFRAEAYGVMNHLNPGDPDATIGSPNAGSIFDGSGERNLQFGLKLSF